MPLTSEQITRFHTSGFLAIADPVIDDRELARVREIYDRMFAEQEATEENGCMWFNDGSHEWEVLEHRSIGNDPRIHGLELVDDSVILNPVVCPLPPGGITIHRNRTAHYTGPNLTDSPRRALILSSRLPTRPYPADRRFPWNEEKKTLRQERAERAQGKADPEDARP